MSTTTTTLHAYEVGGCVRDSFLAIPSKDIDLAVEVESFDTLRDWLTDHEFDIFDEQRDYLTIRARFPENPDPDLALVLPRVAEMAYLTVDFVMCRADGDYVDGRRPDTVVAGTIYDDLARRDYTVNAMARCVNGQLLDPHNGAADLATRTLRAVGDPAARLREDSLRALRAVRFAITKGFTLEDELRAALSSAWLPPLLEDNAHFDRRRAELHAAMRVDSTATMALLVSLGEPFMRAALAGLWLRPTNQS